MSLWRNRDTIDARTWASIQNGEGWHDGEVYECGCEPHPKEPQRFHLCDFHEGYDEGVTLMRPLVAEVERLHAERDAERWLADRLESHLRWALRCVSSLPLELRHTFDNRMAEVLAAHKEARRG